MTAPKFFVAGATGYTGREVVRRACAKGYGVVAHIRPDSRSRDEWEPRFTDLGAEVDLSPWEPDAIRSALAAVQPSHVFSLLGTTRSRAREEEARRGGEVSYETVDFGLTKLLFDACTQLSTPPRFVYLSSMGVGEDEPSQAYLNVRWRLEQTLREGVVPYTIVRPSFISGPNRDESRPAERIGATIADSALTLVGWLGGGRLRDRYQSLDNHQLAAAMLRLATDPAAEGQVIEADELRARSR